MRGGIDMKKYTKIILLILLVALIFFVSNTIRKIVIFGELEDKIVKLNTKDNIYCKMESGTQVVEIYKKDKQVKINLTDKRTNEKQVIQM